MDRTGREHVLIERSADRAGVQIRIIQSISVWVSSQCFEKRIEVVRWLVDVEHENWPSRAHALAKDSECDLHRNQRVFPLRRSIIGDNDRSIVGRGCYIGRGPLQ